MPENKIHAPCGKLVNPRHLKRHEALCSKCAELGNVGTGVPAKSPNPVPMIDVQSEADITDGDGDENQQPGAPAPQIDQPPVNLADSDPADDEDVVRRVVAQLAPALNKQTEAMNALIEQFRTAKPLTPDEQAAAIDKAVERQINKLVEDQRAAQSAKAGVGAETGGNGAGDDWSSRLGTIIEKAAPLFRQNQNPGNSMEMFNQMLSAISKQAETQIGIFRSGSEFASSLISSAAKMGADPGRTADQLRKQPLMERNPD